MTADYDRYDLTTMQIAEPRFGAQTGRGVLRTHPRSQCEGRGLPCVIHDPSDHHMREWELNWRSDTGVMERICRHGIGHPDPDHMTYVTSLAPEHICIDKYLRENDVPLRGDLYYQQLCPHTHMEWQAIHGCDGCCDVPK